MLSMDERQNIIQGIEQDRGIFYEEKLSQFSSERKSDFGGVKWFGGYTNNDFFPALDEKDETVEINKKRGKPAGRGASSAGFSG